LDIFAHCFNRYTAHRQGQNYAELQCRNHRLDERASEFSRLCDIQSGTDADFIAAANTTLVAGRRILKNSYCFVYFCCDEKQKELFQMHQERLERFTEALSGLSENARTHIDRAKVVSLIGVVQKCLKGMIGFLQYGSYVVE